MDREQRDETYNMIEQVVNPQFEEVREEIAEVRQLTSQEVAYLRRKVDALEQERQDLIGGLELFMSAVGGANYVQTRRHPELKEAPSYLDEIEVVGQLRSEHHREVEVAAFQRMLDGVRSFASQLN